MVIRNMAKHVVAAAQIVSRTGKLAYEWRGLAGLPQLLDRLVADKVTNAASLGPTSTLFGEGAFGHSCIRTLMCIVHAIRPWHAENLACRTLLIHDICGGLCSWRGSQWRTGCAARRSQRQRRLQQQAVPRRGRAMCGMSLVRRHQRAPRQRLRRRRTRCGCSAANSCACCSPRRCGLPPPACAHS